MRSSSVVSAFRNASSNAQVMRRDHVDLQQARVWVPRLKNGLSVEHDELRAIKRYLATRDCVRGMANLTVLCF
jgi:hypothetical protein